MGKLKIVFLVGIGVFSSQKALSAEGDKDYAGSRAEMQSHLLDQRIKEQSLFSSSPVYHVVPKSKTVLLGGNFETLNLNLAPLNTNIADGSTDNASELITMTGWTAAPIVAVSAKSFGMAASAEIGERSVYYRSIDTVLNPGTLNYAEQSEVAFSGVGLYIYWLPDWKWIPKLVTPSFTFGRRTISVVHKNKQIFQNTENAYTNYRYNVRKDDMGFNFGIRLVKKVVVLPWYNYTKIVVDEADSPFEDGEPSSLVADKELIWRSGPKNTYGIDINVKISRLNIQVGGFLGLIGSLNQYSDRIYEKSFSVAASWDFKSK